MTPLGFDVVHLGACEPPSPPRYEPTWPPAGRSANRWRAQTLPRSGVLATGLFYLTRVLPDTKLGGGGGALAPQI